MAGMGVGGESRRPCMTLSKSLHLSEPLFSAASGNTVLLISSVTCSVRRPGTHRNLGSLGPGAHRPSHPCLCPLAQGSPASVIRSFLAVG